MHADVGNVSTIAGITKEYFQRVLSHYNPPPKPHPSPAPPSAPAYACISDRCILVDKAAGSSSDPKCGGACKSLAANEWLAVRSLSVLNTGKKLLTVRLPDGQNTTYLKKTEKRCESMHGSKALSLCLTVHNGETIGLSVPAVSFSSTYFLVQLASESRGGSSSGLYRAPVPLPQRLRQYGIAKNGSVRASVAAEGRVNQDRDGKDSPGVMQAPFRIPYDALLPKRAELTNVLVPVAASMSHVRQNAVRMEPTWMIMAHAAGSAAAMILQNSSESSSSSLAVQDLDVAALQRLLVEEQSQMIWPDQRV